MAIATDMLLLSAVLVETLKYHRFPAALVVILCYVLHSQLETNEGRGRIINVIFLVIFFLLFVKAAINLFG